MIVYSIRVLKSGRKKLISCRCLLIWKGEFQIVGYRLREKSLNGCLYKREIKNMITKE